MGQDPAGLPSFHALEEELLLRELKQMLSVSKLVIGVFPRVSWRPVFTVSTAGQTAETGQALAQDFGTWDRKAGLQD